MLGGIGRGLHLRAPSMLLQDPTLLKFTRHTSWMILFRQARSPAGEGDSWLLAGGGGARG